MKIKLSGRPVSKKRSYKPSKNGGFYLDEKYTTWKNDALRQLKTYKGKHTGYIEVNYTFNVHGYRIIDLDNAIVGINDLLQDAGIIENDRYILSIIAKKVLGCDTWETEIQITEFDLEGYQNT